MKKTLWMSRCVQILVRYMSRGAIPEDRLFCLMIPKHETAQGMLSVLHGYIDEKCIPWDWKVGLHLRWAGLCTLIMNVSPSAIWTHCMTHREQLAEKVLSTELKDILQKVTSIVNYIKPHPLCASLFETLCGDKWSDIDNVLFHADQAAHRGLMVIKG